MPQAPFLVLTTVTNSSGTAEAAAEVVYSSSSGTSAPQITDSLGRIIYDLSTIGYTDGETITVTTNDRFNNDISTDTFEVSEFMYVLNITLTQRTKFSGIVTGYKVPSIIHTVGDKPVTKDNPLPINIIGSNITVDLVNNPETTNVYDTRGRLSTETITLGNGERYRRTFIYTGTQWQFTTRGRWVKI